MEGLLWNLLEAYEARLEMRSPLDLEDASMGSWRDVTAEDY